MTGQRVLVTGATGMVGGHALRLCLESAEVATVTTLGRRATGLEHPGLREVVHHDLGRIAPVEEVFAGCDLALYCLGAYTGAVSDDVFRTITVDYTVAFADALHRLSPQAVLCFLSGQGADPTGTSRMAFARYKGAAENHLRAVGFPRLHIFRPGYIYPVTPRSEPNWFYRVSRTLYPVVSKLYPDIGLRSDDLARAMVHAGLHGTPDHPDPVLENRDIRAFATTLGYPKVV